MEDTLENIKNFFNSMAKTWDDKNCDSQGAKKIIEQFKDNISNKEILDVGCGTGVLYEELLSSNAKSITCIDISNEMINCAKEKYPDGNFICEDILDWQTNKLFDTIIMYNVYPHLQDKSKLRDKIYGLLNEKGMFIVAHGASREQINSHHQAHALGVSQKLLKAHDEAEIWKEKFDINIIRDDNLYYFSGIKKIS